MNAKNVAIGVGVVVVAVLLYKGYEAGKKIVTVDLNPTNSGNFANSAVTSIGQSISGDPNWTLGGSIYSLFHTPYNPNAATSGTSTTSSSSTGFWASLGL